jgi:hypothetical protein
VRPRGKNRANSSFSIDCGRFRDVLIFAVSQQYVRQYRRTYCRHKVLKSKSHASLTSPRFSGFPNVHGSLKIVSTLTICRLLSRRACDSFKAVAGRQHGHHKYEARFAFASLMGHALSPFPPRRRDACPYLTAAATALRRACCAALAPFRHGDATIVQSVGPTGENTRRRFESGNRRCLNILKPFIQS